MIEKDSKCEIRILPGKKCMKMRQDGENLLVGKNLMDVCSDSITKNRWRQS
jgi:hypothetical protein